MKPIDEGKNELTIIKKCVDHMFGGKVSTYNVTFKGKDDTQRKDVTNKWGIYRDALYHYGSDTEISDPLKHELCGMHADASDVFKQHVQNEEMILQFNLADKFLGKLKES